MLSDIAYLDWISGRPDDAEFDLGSSDLRRAPADPGSVVPPALAGLPDPPADATLDGLLADEYGVGPENVLVTAGATHANLLAAAAALDAAAAAGDRGETPRAVVEDPGYEPLVATPRGLGATVDRFARPVAEGCPLDPDRVADALAADGAAADAALVTVTNRHNPSGRRVGRDALRAVAEVAADASGRADAPARLLVDEVYAPFGTDPGDGPFGGPTAVGLPNAVVTNSLTKFLGFGGLRIGWLVADEAFVERARAAKNHVPAVAEPSRRLARRALANADELAAESRERVRTNREALAEFAADRDDLRGSVEPGCSYALLAHEAADGDEVAAAAAERGALVVPGRFFDASEYVRVGACARPDAVRGGLDALGSALDDCSGAGTPDDRSGGRT
ncbi:pyridoxal phosphate-dependent aminotransferase [Halorussus salilacus]|uniref:pyridoxal phosphate-dependent aminotransferase n=1 Tax=Halorussus salilacus TaxID=2953750 RepID=UPI00209D8ACD|nr:pyridoxal phosphate-dependent aminotransferase [Halorussus salilacus]USZ68329.1 pyridoxal phosphate-dependent aminotransferase [Halorussus salilacus]